MSQGFVKPTLPRYVNTYLSPSANTEKLNQSVLKYTVYHASYMIVMLSDPHDLCIWERNPRKFEGSDRMVKKCT